MAVKAKYFKELITKITSASRIWSRIGNKKASAAEEKG